MQLTIDGKQVTVEEGQTLLEVARAAGIDIPTLCHHEALEPRGACRLCTVEISNPKWAGWSKLVASCVYPAQDGLVVRTSTEQLEELRTVLVDLLLARCPETEPVRELGRRYGLEATSYRPRAEDDGCILCGMCVRTCEDVIGASAIGVSGRGAVKRVGPAFGLPAASCIGCGACVHVCPTDCIGLVDEGLTRRIDRWGVSFALVPCRVCGKPVTTREHIDFVRARVGVGVEVLETCPDCQRSHYAAKVAAEGHM